jgi:hypothetical protein
MSNTSDSPLTESEKTREEDIERIPSVDSCSDDDYTGGKSVSRSCGRLSLIAVDGTLCSNDRSPTAVVFDVESECYEASPVASSPTSVLMSDGAGAGLRRERISSKSRKRLLTSKSLPKSVMSDGRDSSVLSPAQKAADQDSHSVRSSLNEYLSTIMTPGENVSQQETSHSMKRLLQLVINQNNPCDNDALVYALNRIYTTMQEHVHSSLVQERALLVLGRLARENDAVLGKIAGSKGATRIVEAMIEHKASSIVQDRAVATLLYLTNIQQGRDEIVGAKGAECVCWAMKEFIRDKSIQMQGSTALCNLAFGSADHKKRIGKIGGIDGVIKAMEAHQDDSELQARCCLALRNLTCGVRVNQWIAGRSCAIEGIVRAMIKFGEVVEVQYQGCVALANICADEPDNRCRAAEIGVIEATLKAIGRNMKHLNLAEHGLALLRNLSVGNQANQVHIGETDGIMTVLSCIREHMKSRSVLENACSLLRYLLFAKENRLFILQCNGLEVLVRVLREGASHQGVAEAAIYALGNAVYDNPESKSAIGKYGGISALVEVMSSHLDSAAIQEHGCRALRNLADSDELTTRLLAESGAIDTSIFSCQAYPRNANIQEQAIAMLFNVAYSETNVQRMKGLDVERVVNQAREYHEDVPGVQSQAAALMQRLQNSGSDENLLDQSGRDGPFMGNRLQSIVSMGGLVRKLSSRPAPKGNSKRDTTVDDIGTSGVGKRDRDTERRTPSSKSVLKLGSLNKETSHDRSSMDRKASIPSCGPTSPQK